MMVQYFERARFELNESEHVQPIDPNWAEGQTDAVYLDRVHLTPLGSQLQLPTFLAACERSGQARCHLVSRDRPHHHVAHSVRLWLTHKAPFFGEPLSEQIVETIDGQAVTVQYFEKWRMELTADGTVRLGQSGAGWRWRSGPACVAGNGPVSPSLLTGITPSFVHPYAHDTIGLRTLLYSAERRLLSSTSEEAEAFAQGSGACWWRRKANPRCAGASAG